MAKALSRPLLEVSVSETDEGRGFWLDRPWVGEERRLGLLSAAVMVVPKVSPNESPVFPVGTGEFLSRLQGLLGADLSVSVAMSSDEYAELALHSKAWRLPTMIVTGVVLPVIATILANRLDEVLPGFRSDDTAEIELIVETPDRGALKLSYKGPAEDMGGFLQSAVSRYVDNVAAPVAAPPDTPEAE